MAGDRQYIEPGFDNKAQAALGPAQNTVEIEAAICLAQVSKVIAGEAAVKFGKICAIR